MFNIYAKLKNYNSAFYAAYRNSAHNSSF